ncbi:MAG TPA: hypothetical protein P5190_11360 [Bacteroidales bacterium]|nr:hypothetical protein [Bacteroidales bacterium]
MRYKTIIIETIIYNTYALRAIIQSIENFYNIPRRGSGIIALWD